jgi:hypothetical protein
MPFFTGISRSIGGVGFGSKRRELFRRYFAFTSPGTLDLSSIPQIVRVDYFSIGYGGSGSGGTPGFAYSSNGGAGGAGGASGRVTVLLNNTNTSPQPISIGAIYPTSISGPNSGGPGNSLLTLTIPQEVKDIFSDYTISSYPKGTDAPGRTDSFGGDGGYGGAGGVWFQSNQSLPTIYLPDIPYVSGSTGGTGGTVVSAGGNAYRYGGYGGTGGGGYGAGGGGGGGGAEYDGNTSSGAPGGGGSSGLVVVKVTYRG